MTTQVNRPALALVDGIPLYAPGEKIALPERGFEYWLPRMEQIQSVALPAVRSTVSNGDWASLSPFFGTVPAQLSVFGNLASIMGDEGTRRASHHGLGLVFARCACGFLMC